MSTVVALLRAINVGRRRVAMAALRQLAEELGLKGPRTHLNSGNLIVDSDLTEAELVALLEPALADRFGFEVPVVVRTTDELRAALAAVPFADAEPSQLMITFCDRPPPAELAEQLRAVAADHERVVVHDRLIIVDHRGGLARSRLAAATLPVIGTARNLRTVRALVALAEPAPD